MILKEEHSRVSVSLLAREAAPPYFEAPVDSRGHAYTQFSPYSEWGCVMAYMIPYYQSGLLIKFRCTDCDWAYCVNDPSSARVSREEEESAKKQYTAHRCSEFSGKQRKDS